jgi:hypothetical protein
MGHPGHFGFALAARPAAPKAALLVLLFLVGGGTGQIAFFIPTMLVSTRINKPLTWWRKVLTGKLRSWLAGVWRYSLPAVVLFLLIALEIAIFGFVPGLSDPDLILAICWSFLAAAWILKLVTFMAGFAYDIQSQPASLSGMIKNKTISVPGGKP